MLIKLSGYQTISTAESGFGRKDDQGREYKIDWGPGLRIHLAKDGLKIIILIGGGTKKRQQQDIDQAVVLWENYKRRKTSTTKGAK